MYFTEISPGVVKMEFNIDSVLYIDFNKNVRWWKRHIHSIPQRVQYEPIVVYWDLGHIDIYLRDSDKLVISSRIDSKVESLRRYLLDQQIFGDPKDNEGV